MIESKFTELAAINVNSKTEKKGNLTYLSWVWAVDTLMRHDPAATWEYKQPTYFAETLMVYCSVTAFGKTMQAQLPVMDHRNKAITNPDAFQVNTAMQRCLAKAIALHGLGLYIYAGEDLPSGAEPEPENKGKKGDGPVITPKGTIGDDLPDDVKSSLVDIAAQCVDFVKEGQPRRAYEFIKEQKLEADQEVWLSRQMDSKTRAAIKASKDIPL